jgi:hypothetical protein
VTTTVTCPGCAHANRSHRGYCGKCGVTLQPVCRGCRFVNDRTDRYCGGCGSHLVEMLNAPAPSTTTEKVGKSGSELTDLFAPTPDPSAREVLPAAGITQDDLDRLFGVVP